MSETSVGILSRLQETARIQRTKAQQSEEENHRKQHEARQLPPIHWSTGRRSDLRTGKR